MAYGITITGLREAQQLLGVRFAPAIDAATKAVALELEGRIAPYPRASEANSPGNPTGRWYERGYGPRWLRKDGSVGGSKTSQMLGRQWLIRKAGAMAHAVANRASYAPFVHSAAQQAIWHAKRNWVTDKAAIEALVASGVVKRIVVQAIVAAIRRRA